MHRTHVETSTLLGLPGDYSMLEWARLLRDGLPTSAFERVCEALAPGDKTFPYAMVPRSTLVRRRQEKRLTPEESELVERIADVWSFTVDVFHDESKARQFLTRPHSLLRGECPIDLAIANGKGAIAVKDILGRLKYGSAA